MLEFIHQQDVGLELLAATFLMTWSEPVNEVSTEFSRAEGEETDF